MRFALIGPGIVPIPPTGWGAIEAIIWDYKHCLEALGHDVLVINTRDLNEVVSVANAYTPDVVHLHYDLYVSVLPDIKVPLQVVTSHYCYLEQRARYGRYRQVFERFVRAARQGVVIGCLSEPIRDVYRQAGVEQERLLVMPNGARGDLIRTARPVRPLHSIYLGRIDQRKRQVLVTDSVPRLHFVGPLVDRQFPPNHPHYLGEWRRERVYEDLTTYANLVLLSDGEAAPLVVCEALIAGLGLVLSRPATANLDISMPFIDVIEEENIRDRLYVAQVIERNRDRSAQMRDAIRSYGMYQFSWAGLVDKYVANLIRIMDRC